MEETLEASLARIFKVEHLAMQSLTGAPLAAGAVTEPAGSAEASDLMQQAGDAYDRAVQAQRQGDWAKYGEEIRKLGGILRDLSKARGAGAPKAP
jgi:uncharacterized membrane protein (UPF0182 family)